MNFSFKHKKLIPEYDSSPLLLQILIKDIANFIKETFDKEMVITRILGTDGVHASHRAFDFRDHYKGEFTYSEAQRNLILNYINTKWRRVDDYETCLWHKGTDWHFHCQIPLLTEELRTSNY